MVVAVNGTNRFNSSTFAIAAQSAKDIVATGDNTGENCIAGIFVASKTGTITDVGVSVSGAVTGSPTFRIAIETVSAQRPTGTLWNTPTNTTYVDYSPTGTPSPNATWQALGVAASVTIGDIFAVTLRGVSPTDGSNHASFNAYLGSGITPVTPFALTKATTTWTAQTGIPCLCPKYSDGEILRGCAMISSSTVNDSFKDTTNPDERGIEWVAEQIGSCTGCVVGLATTTTGTGTVSLYEDGVLVRSLALNGASFRGTALGATYLTWSTPYTTVAASTYRITLTATNGEYWKIGQYTYPDVASRNHYFGNGWYCTYNNGAYVASDTVKSASIYPIFDSITPAEAEEPAPPAVLPFGASKPYFIKKDIAGSSKLIFHRAVWDPNTLAGKTGLVYSDFTVAYIRNGGTLVSGLSKATIAALGTYVAPANNTTINIKEVSAANAPGLYEFHIHADWVATGADNLTIYIGVSACQCLPIEVVLCDGDPFPTEVAGLPDDFDKLAIDASTGGVITNSFTAKAITAAAFDDGILATADVIPTAAAGTAGGLPILGPAGTVASGTHTSSSFTTNLSSAVDNYWRGCFIKFVSSTNLAGQVKKILSYTGSTKAIGCEAFTVAPTAGDTFVIINE